MKAVITGTIAFFTTFGVIAFVAFIYWITTML